MEQQTKYHNIFITDLQMHVLQPRKPLPWYRVVMKSIRSGLPGRAYTTEFSVGTNQNQGNKVVFPLPQETIQEMEKARALGKKIRFIIPETGIPIYAGKDTLEYIQAKRNKIASRI